MVNFLIRRRRALIAAAAVAGLGLWGASAAWAQNLLLDPGFEADPATGLPSAAAGAQQTSPAGGPASSGPWLGYNTYNPPYTAYYSNAVNHTPGGSQAGQTYGGTTYAGGIWQFVKIVPGDAYTAQMWFYNLSSDPINTTGSAPNVVPQDNGQREDVQMSFFTGPNGTGQNLYTVASPTFSGLNPDGSANWNNWVEETATTQAISSVQSVEVEALYTDPNGYYGGSMFVDDASLIDTTFNGGGTTNNFSDAGNWNGVAPSAYAPLVFGASARTAINNDTLAGTAYYGINFTANATAYVITGNELNLASNVTNNSPNTQTLALTLGLQQDTVFNAAAGNITVSGNIGGAFSLIKQGPNTLTLSGSNTYTGATNIAAGTVVLASATALPAGNNLFIAANSSLVANNLGAPVGLTVGSLSVLGKLDLNNNALVVHDSSVTAVTALVQSGYNNGAWNGATGIISSAAAVSSNHLTALGVIPNDNGSGTPLYGPGGAIASTLDGASPVDGDVLVKYTYYGDTNLNGKVDGTDYSRIDAAVAANQSNPGSATGWFNGDFNYDGVIDGSDYTLIDNAYNTQGAQLSDEISAPTAQIAGAVGTAAVPEPAMSGMFGIAAAGVLGRRKRRLV